ncbi:MAG TPA: arabinofuranosidase catalytic domain-containing protein [Bacteroidales bacterium]|nr:arabinofuranosidase catalytic domain-containing protein [Bacteroidales bacterium]
MKKKSRFLFILGVALVFPVSMMLLAMKLHPGDAQSRPEGPCDIYKAAGFPCVTAHSSTRALLKSYNGPLYQVKRQSDGKTLDIMVVQPGDNNQGGYADAAAQDEFCKNTLCNITIIYDQSGNGNHLMQAPPGTYRGPENGGFNTLPIADMAPITIMGHKAYGVYIIPGMGLRNNNATGLAVNDEPEGIYAVVDGTHYDSGCCFNYGNASTNSRAVGRGTMETVYFGNATAWGSGNGNGPWIMSDMEAGLFSGYNAKQNVADPTIDSWKFVTGAVAGGGGNKWEIRGANAQKGGLKTFYSGIRPGSLESNNYYPMHRKGAVQLGNGGDNGNGSAGTFYEGVMTSGYPDASTLSAVQANIVSAKYDVQRLGISRVTSFTPGSSQSITATFTNTTGTTVAGLKLGVSVPGNWKASAENSNVSSRTFTGEVAAGATVNATFTIMAPEAPDATYVTATAEWKNIENGSTMSESTSQRLRNVIPVKINEISFDMGVNPYGQFIELYNAGEKEADISGWNIISTKNGLAPVRIATIPSGTRLAGKGFYLLGLSESGLIAPVNSGEKIINVISITGFESGQQADIEGEIRTIAKVGTAASPVTSLYVPVSTGPWLTIPAGSTNIPVTNAAGFVAGQRIGIDLGGNYEVATVTSVGKAATQSNLAAAAKAGETTIKVVANENVTVGDTLTIDTGSRMESIVVKNVVSVASSASRAFNPVGGPEAGNTGVLELTAPLKQDHMIDVDVAGRGTGISFKPATRFAHKSGEAVQALGSGITLDKKLEKSHGTGTAVVNTKASPANHRIVKANLWYGLPFSAASGSLALTDASGKIIIDAIVYGSRQSNSSANGTVTSPELATLEGVQSQGGCIVVSPVQVNNLVQPIAAEGTDRSAGRFPDGSDTDSNCSDFIVHVATTLTSAVKAGSNNIKISNVSDFTSGQKITIGIGTSKEVAVIAEIGTSGGTSAGAAISQGVRSIPVNSAEGFYTGQTITIDDGANLESAVVASTFAARRRPGAPSVQMDSIRVSTPLKFAHAAAAQVSGSGITLANPLKGRHEAGSQVAGSVPTPGEPNQY